jgi:short-subunit dehydrogenase
MRSLVTGATAGLGAEFARQLAASGSDLVLVARDAARLEETAAALRSAHGVKVQVLRADLAEEPDLTVVAERLADSGSPIDVLVNNAGFGLHAKLANPDLRLQRRAMDVMCWAVLALSGSAAGAMRERGNGTIINVSSLASWTTSGNYSAIKAWVRSYSQGLSNELRGTGVTVTAACPGWVRTEFHQRAGIRTSAIPGWVWADPGPVVQRILRDAERGRVVTIPAARWRIAQAMLKLAPQSGVRSVSRMLVSSRD